MSTNAEQDAAIEANTQAIAEHTSTIADVIGKLESLGGRIDALAERLEQTANLHERLNDTVTNDGKLLIDTANALGKIEADLAMIADAPAREPTEIFGFDGAHVAHVMNKFFANDKPGA